MQLKLVAGLMFVLMKAEGLTANIRRYLLHRKLG